MFSCFSLDSNCYHWCLLYASNQNVLDHPEIINYNVSMSLNVWGLHLCRHYNCIQRLFCCAFVIVCVTIIIWKVKAKDDFQFRVLHKNAYNWPHWTYRHADPLFCEFYFINKFQNNQLISIKLQKNVQNIWMANFSWKLRVFCILLEYLFIIHYYFIRIWNIESNIV